MDKWWRKLIAALLPLFLYGVSHGASVQQQHSVIMQKNKGAAAPACVAPDCQNFNAAGPSVTTAPGWITLTCNTDSTASPLEGAQDISCAPTQNAMYDGNWNSALQYFTFWLKFSDPLDANELFLDIRDSTNAVLGNFNLRSDGACTCQALTAGTISTSPTTCTAGMFTTGVKYKLRFIQGAGATDAQLTAWKWDGSAWSATPLCDSANGALTTNIDRVRLINNADTEVMQFDMFKFSSSDIASPD